MTVNSVIVGTIVLKIFSPPCFCGTTTHTLYYGYVLLIQVVYNGEVKTKISSQIKSKTQRQNYKKLGGPEKIHWKQLSEGKLVLAQHNGLTRKEGGT